MSLKNKVIVISGGGSGIGAEVAKNCLKQGAKVLINGRDKNKLEATKLALDPDGESLAVVAGDIGDQSVCNAIVASAVSQFGKIDVLFNNAGIFFPKPFLQHSLVDINNYLNLLKGYYLLTQAVVTEMKKGTGGSIVNTGSMWALHAIEATPCSGSSMAKGGVHALTKNLAIELAPDNIRVNAIAPAVVETPLFDGLLTSEQLAGFNSFHPLGRNGQVEDISNAVQFLADEEQSGWITGVILPVDGGVTTGRNVISGN